MCRRHQKSKGRFSRKGKAGIWFSEQTGANIGIASCWMTNMVLSSIEHIYVIAYHFDMDV